MYIVFREVADKLEEVITADLEELGAPDAVDVLQGPLPREKGVLSEAVSLLQHAHRLALQVAELRPVVVADQQLPADDDEQRNALSLRVLPCANALHW